MIPSGEALPSEKNREITIFAQPGEGNSLVYKAKGQKTILIDRKHPKTAEIEIGSRVKGLVKHEDERKIILTPLEVSPPVQKEIQAVLGEEGTLIGHDESGRTVLFYTDSPITPNIRPRDTVRGVVIRDEPTYIWLYPQDRVLGMPEIMAAPEVRPVHAFVPIILNELVRVSQGLVRSEALGMKAQSQAFEDLVAASFEFLNIGALTPLGYRVGGSPAPDGDVFCPNRERAKYVLLYDAKIRSGEPGYLMTLGDKRAFEEYIRDPKYRLVSERALLVISTRFADEPIQLSGGTLTFVPANVLALICSWKAMNPALVTEESLKYMFFAGKILTEEDVRKWSRELRLREIPI